MKKVSAIFLTLIVLSQHVLAQNVHNELLDIADVIQESNLEVDTWEVTLKEHISQTQANKLIQELNNSHSVTMDETENSHLYSVLDTHKTGTITVSYNVIQPKSEHYKPELVVTIKGNKWNEDVKSAYMKTLFEIKHKYFTNNVKTFACMSTRANAIIKIDKNIENFTEKLKMQHITTQKDDINSTNNVEIIYGYSSLWGNKITIQDTPVNVQIVAKTLAGGDVQYLIGTPILINEY